MNGQTVCVASTILACNIAQTVYH